MYKIYHIIGKKVGISSQIEKRLADQGYSLDEVDILGQEENCINALRKECEWSDKFNYKRDGFFHPHMLTMEYKTYEGNTIGFPVELQNFEGWLKDHKNGYTLRTHNKTMHIKLGDENHKWVVKNVKKSKFPNGNLRTFLYCKALDEAFVSGNDKIEKDEIGLDKLISLVHDWADDRGILDGNITTQSLKLGEEFGELQHAVLKDKKEEIKDAIGDIIVVLVSIAHFNGHSVRDAVEHAYNIISKRKGHTNAKGDFIKETL